MTDKPPCVKCNRTKKVVPSGERDWFCGACGITFNVEPGENSDVHSDPSRRMEREQARGIGLWRRR